MSRACIQPMQSRWLQVFVGGLRRRCRRTLHWVAAGSFRKSLQIPKISRLRLQKSSTGRVSVGTRANFGSWSTIKVAIFGCASRGPSSAPAIARVQLPDPNASSTVASTCSRCSGFAQPDTRLSISSEALSDKYGGYAFAEGRSPTRAIHATIFEFDWSSG